MKQKLRIVALFLCALLALTGCGAGSNTGTKDGEVMTITWLPQCDSPVDENSPVIKELEKELGVNFEFIYIDRSKKAELLNVRIASGEIPDVFVPSDVNTFGLYMQQGVLAEIPEKVLMNEGKTLYEITKQNGGDNIWEYAKEDGKIYGIPILSIQGQYPLVPIWRDDWLREVGIDKIPETLEEAEKAFYAFANNDPDGNGQKDTYGLSNNGMQAVYGAFGIQPEIWQEIDGKVVYTSTTAQMKEALMLLNKWYKDGVIDPEFISGENKGQSWANAVSFWNGKIGFSVPGMYYNVSEPNEYSVASVNYSNFKKIQGDDASYVAAKPFTGKDGKSGTTKWGVFSGAMLCVGRHVKDDPAKMAKIIEINNRLMEDEELYALVVKGIEGEHYEIRNDRYVNIVDTTADSLALSKLGLSSNGIGYLNGNNFEFAKLTNADRYETADKIANFEGYQNAILGSLPSSAQYMPTITAKVQEAKILFITGEKPFSEWDQYVEELNHAGLSTLTQEANDWYNKYN